MKDWDVSVPYLLPRIVYVRRIRSNTLPAKTQKPSVRIGHLGDINARWAAWRRSDYFYPEMIPDPDYSDTEEESEGVVDEDEDDSDDSADERLRDVETMEDDSRRHRVKNRSGGTISKHRSGASSRKPQQHSSEDLIQPRKPSNPYLESMERKNLHKELKFNQKYGKTVGSQKTELQVALEKYTDGKIKRDLAASRRSSLEKILEQQAQKIEQHEREGSDDTRPSWIDRLQRQHITSRADPNTDEFFRVHARVVSSLMTSSGSDESGQSSAASSASPSESE